MAEPTIAFLFPGQGSQKPGMGQALAADFPAAREVFQEVDEALGERLSRLIADGPADQLTLTRNAQPALMAVSLAAFRVLQTEVGLDPVRHLACVAGHSLGEWSALTAVGCLPLADCARLLRLRGDSMQEAVPLGTGAMAAILGMELAEIEPLCAQAAAAATQAAEAAARTAGTPAPPPRVCVAANDNAPGQIVISGHADAVAQAVDLARAAGKKAMPLPVSAPFHSPLMEAAAERMAAALATQALMPPAVPVVANVTATPTQDPNQIRRLLVDQITGRVRWTESIQALPAAGVTRVVEVGAGRVLAGLVKRIDRSLEVLNLEAPQDLDAIARVL